MAKSFIILLLVLTSCGSAYHQRRAAFHLSKLDSSDARSVTTDSTARKVIFAGKKDSFKFKEVPKVPMYLKGKEGIKTKYLRERDTVYLEVECPPDTVTVYDTKTTTVYEIPPSYKAFVKQLFGINNFQFWLFHFIGLLSVGLFVYVRIFK